MNVAVLVLIQLALTTDRSVGMSAENISQLHDDLPTLRSNIRPSKNSSVSTDVHISFHLISINSFDTVQQKLVSNGWLAVRWINDYFLWDPEDYGGVYTTSLQADQTWRPKITVMNTLKDLKPIGEEYVVLTVQYDGWIIWYPAERFETFCPVDVTYFPFDTQRCRWEIFIWGGDEAYHTNMELVIPRIDLDTFQENGEWNLMSTKAWKENRTLNDQTFSFLVYQVTLRRRPSLLVLTVLLPVMVLALVNVFVFTIPSEAGERLAYSMTALLSFGVFMSFILDSMPSSTETLSIVAVHMSGLLVLSALYVLLCILSLRLFHRDSAKHPVPDTLQSLIVWLELIVCLDPPNKTAKVDVIELQTVMDLTLSDVTGQQTKAMGAVNKAMGKLDKWAASRKRNHAAYTNPDEMTWRRVSRTLDKLLFRFFFFLVVASHVAVFCNIMHNYYDES